MKKFLRILFVVFITIVIFVGCDILFFYHMAKNTVLMAKSVEKYTNYNPTLPTYFIKLQRVGEYYQNEINQKRPVMNPESKMDSIIIFGCSYAYGYVFDNNQTISYVLSKYSKRPIYNRAINSWGIQHAIYQLNDKNFFKDIKTKPRYIFYVLMDNSGHFERLYYTAYPSIVSPQYYLTYKIKNNELIERKPFLNIYYNFALFRHIQNKLTDKWVNENFYKHPNKKIFNLFILHFKTINQLIKLRWDEADNRNYPKFVILSFENTKKEFWYKELQKEGIDFIDIAQTIGIENLNDTKKGLFEPETFSHPNGKLWELLVPKLKEIYPDL